MSNSNHNGPLRTTFLAIRKLAKPRANRFVADNRPVAPRLAQYRYVRLRWRLLCWMFDRVGYALGRTVRRLVPSWETVRSGADSSAKDDSIAGDAAAIRSILVVQMDHLGDAILSTGWLNQLRRTYPRAEIDILATPWNRAIFREAGPWRRVFTSRRNRFAREARRWLWPVSVIWWGSRLRSRRYDLAFDVRGDLSVALLMWLCGARRRVGFAAAGGGFLLTASAESVFGRAEVLSRKALFEAARPQSGRQAITPLRVAIHRAAVSLSAAVNHRSVARESSNAQLAIARHDSNIRRRHEANGETTSDESRWYPRIEPGERALRKMANRLQDLRRPGCPLVVLHVGAGTSAKRWPIVHWRELLGRLIVQRDATVVLVGDAGDRALVRRITRSRAWPHVVDWTGQLRIGQLAALLQQCDCFVGADSGPAHLAAAVGSRAVVLFSGTVPASQWRPRGDRIQLLQHAVACSPCLLKTCPLADHPCMQGVLPEAVMRHIDRLWYDSFAPSDGKPAGKAGSRQRGVTRLSENRSELSDLSERSST
jgi:ADP-heptose:LPS heptosyltransferase